MKKVPLLAASVVLGAATLTGCAGTAYAGNDCLIGQPTIQALSPDRVSGYVTVTCKTQPKTQTLALKIQHQRAGASAWSTVSTNPPDSNPVGPERRFSITAPCSPGKWRMVIAVSGVSSTGKQFDSGEQPSPKETEIKKC
ncbi:hypothetical protein ACFXDJ_06655 [Streptomyces sp. NPDC059443]|uniref:hypothetical protein n=1 Tax=unclassified Streptomyces TaxID=2593676 RepID=UPI0036AFB5F7